MTHESTRIGGWNSVYNRTPDVEVLASATVRVGVTRVAESSTGINIVFVDEGKAHVLCK
jgi:hypothetical protein